MWGNELSHSQPHQVAHGREHGTKCPLLRAKPKASQFCWGVEEEGLCTCRQNLSQHGHHVARQLIMRKADNGGSNAHPAKNSTSKVEPCTYIELDGWIRGVSGLCTHIHAHSPQYADQRCPILLWQQTQLEEKPGNNKLKTNQPAPMSLHTAQPCN